MIFWVSFKALNHEKNVPGIEKCPKDSNPNHDPVCNQERSKQQNGIEYFGVLDSISPANHHKVNESNDNQATDNWQMHVQKLNVIKKLLEGPHPT